MRKKARDQVFAVLTGALTLVAVVSTPSAGADPGDAAFLRDIKSRPLYDNWGRQITTSDSKFLAIGQETCGFLAGGDSIHDVIARLSTDFSVSMDTSAFIVRTSISDLCPKRWPD